MFRYVLFSGKWENIEDEGFNWTFIGFVLELKFIINCFGSIRK